MTNLPVNFFKLLMQLKINCVCIANVYIFISKKINIFTKIYLLIT
jgi:hypothetical protein